jgi:photoactive yellow protein
MSNPNETPSITSFIDVSASELEARLERMPSSVLDALPFGVIRIDKAGEVIYFSHTEAKQSGYGDRKAIGRKFFSELAPCMGTPEFARRVESAQAAGALDISFEHVGDFDDPERRMLVRMISASAGDGWILLQRARTR